MSFSKLTFHKNPCQHIYDKTGLEIKSYIWEAGNCFNNIV